MDTLINFLMFALPGGGSLSRTSQAHASGTPYADVYKRQEVNSSGKAVSGTLVVSLDADPEKKVEIALSQVAADDEEGGA